MMRASSIPFAVSLLLASAASCPDGLRAQSPGQPAPITLDVTRKLELRAADGSYVHVLAQGKYEVVTGPVNLAGVKDGQFIELKLKYLGGRMLRGDGAGQGTPFTLVDASALDPRFQLDSGIQGPQPDGSVLLNLRVGPDFSLPSEDSSQRGAAELGAACFAGWVNPKISYAELRNLASLGREWNLTPYPPELTESCKGTVVTIHIQALCHDKGLELFEPMMLVFTHPRCINCHGVVNPLTGANHGGGKVDVPPGTDITMNNETCVEACHDAKPHVWRLAPADRSFVGKDAKAVCEQVREFGFPDPEVGGRIFYEHVKLDELIGFGFVGKRGGASKQANPPPMTREQFVGLATKWAADGNHSCGCPKAPATQ